jgi:hypothetical protein
MWLTLIGIILVLIAIIVRSDPLSHSVPSSEAEGAIRLLGIEFNIDLIEKTSEDMNLKNFPFLERLYLVLIKREVRSLRIGFPTRSERYVFRNGTKELLLVCEIIDNRTCLVILHKTKMTAILTKKWEDKLSSMLPEVPVSIVKSFEEDHAF